ncbi:MAG: hemin-binding protein [Arcobacter sp.]|nr:MAG: hemin-binding protein [Arcobacter sp.]
MRNKIIIAKRSTLALSVILANSLYAAAPNIGDVIKQVQAPKKLIKKEVKPLLEIGGVKKYTPMIKDDKSGKRVFVKDFKIEGALHISNKYLQSLISEYKNKKLTFSELKNITSIITKEYRDQGYFVARAYLPVQDIKDTTVTIAIIEGNYGTFKLKNNSLVKDSMVQAMLNDAKRDNIVSTNTLERAMLIINDTPGVIVSGADVLPGKTVGTSDFKITTQASNAYDGYILLDNQGSRYTGKKRLMMGININSPFKLGDKLSLSGLLSNGENLKNARVAYSLPLMPNGLRGEMSYSNTSYSLTKEYESLEAKGTAQALDITLIYPITRTRLENLNLTLNIAKKYLKDEVQSTNDITKKNAFVANFGLSYDKNSIFLDFDSQTTAAITYTLGNLKFENRAKKSDDEAGANTNGTYSKIGFTLGKKVVLSNTITLESLFQYQHALNNKNLDGSEDFSIGGAYGIKVYPDGELSAENGYLFNIEAKYKFLKKFNGISSQVGIFYDRGKAYMANNNVGFKDKNLQDIGIGYYANYKDFFSKVQIAWTANSQSVSSEPSANSRILFQGGWSF